MNRKPTLETQDLELLAHIQREWQAEMRREARQAYLLGKPAGNEERQRVRVKREWVVALVAATLLMAWLAQLALAAQ